MEISKMRFGLMSFSQIQLGEIFTLSMRALIAFAMTFCLCVGQLHAEERAQQLNEQEFRVLTDQLLEKLMRAPRPNGSGSSGTLGSIQGTEPVVPSCDLTQVLGQLAELRHRIGTVQDGSCQETILGILGDACNTLGSGETISDALAQLLLCCASTGTTINADFQGTYSMLNQILNQGVVVDLTGVYTTLTADFGGTWSLIVAESNGTFSVLNEILTQPVTVDLTGVYTTLATDFGGTWTLIVAESNGTFSVLNEILTGGVTVDLTGIYTTLNADFQGSYSALAACCAQTQLDFDQTWTVLGNFNTTTNFVGANIASALDTIDTEIINGFGGTFTVLNEILTSSLTVDLTGVYTTLNADFQGTYSALAACCAQTLLDFQQTWTILAELQSSISADFQSTWSVLGNPATTSFYFTGTGIDIIYMLNAIGKQVGA